MSPFTVCTGRASRSCGFITALRSGAKRRFRRSPSKVFSTVASSPWTPRFNIAPTQPVPVIRQHPKEPIRELSLMKWGLIPSWPMGSTIRCR
ncbi:MAG TPA: SOS response-associated peptidase family protein [Terriglobia bacterium]|nr:SOS response-associated peptidase family protein [Terriglobia bacterium]